MSQPLPAGKLPLDLMQRLLSRYTRRGAGVVVGAGIGEDAAVLELGDRYLIAKTDPITFVAEDVGRYAIQINANDIAVMGGRPRWFLATLLLPEGRTTPEGVEALFREIAEACDALGIACCGGHTEVTAGLDRPIVVGQMLGEVARDRLVTTAGARVGDAVVLTKGIAIEATSIIARERADEVASRFGQGFLERCRRFIDDPGLSVVRDAALALEAGGVHAMHDPTEGGLATGLLEMAMAAGVGLRVDGEAIVVLEETRRLCDAYGLDPLGAIASGALLLAVAPQRVEAVLEALRQGGIAAAVIGRVCEPEAGCRIRWADGERPLPRFPRDEIARLLEETP